MYIESAKATAGKSFVSHPFTFKQLRPPRFTSTLQPLETSKLSWLDALYTPMFVTKPSLQVIEREDFKRRNTERKRKGG